MHTSMIKKGMVLIINMIALVLAGYVCGSVDPYMVKDIWQGSVGSEPRDLTEVNGKLYFIALVGAYGNELWVSDGTESGTMLVKDIYPGSNYSYPFYLTGYNGKLYFRADDGVHGDELWVSDGTQSGTVMVKDIWPGSSSANPSYVTAYNGKLYFSAYDGVHGAELWVSDGTQSGTMLVKDINPGSNDSYPLNLTAYNGKLYFSAYDGVHGAELWVSDGTESGTMMIKDICSGSNSSIPERLGGGISIYNGKLYFRANDGVHGAELWVSDGTESGTMLVKDIWPGVTSSSPNSFTEFAGKFYFRANDGVHGAELWVSDGTESGTMLVKDINPGANDSYLSSFTEFAGKLYFRADDGVHGDELWVSDGTQSGNMMVKDIRPGSYGSSLSYLAVYNGMLCFNAYDVNGTELWVSDGTEPGTMLVKDINPGSTSSNPRYLTEYNGKLYFQADDGIHGAELYALSFCGDGIVQPYEQCEHAGDCDVDYYCEECSCLSVDVDADGILYSEDNCPFIYNPDQTDTDEDGTGDVCDQCPGDFDNDIDGDGVCGDEDNCPDISNPRQENADGDSSGNACDEDDDNDSILDDDDNCPLITNFDQLDTDSDGIGDVCDANPYFPYLVPIADGHYESHIYNCGGIGGQPCYWWSPYNEIIVGYEYPLPFPPLMDISAGILEFSLSSAEDVFTGGFMTAELSLTVKNGILYSSCLALSDLPDYLENGMLEEYDSGLGQGIGDFVGEVCTDLQPGTVITFDVTASLEYDLFAPDQSGFTGFVLYPDGFPAEQYIEFYDHTDPENGPRLTIINPDPDDDGISNEEDNCPDLYNPDQADADGDCMGDACDPDPNDPDNPVAMVDLDSDGIADACDNCPVASNHGQEDTCPPGGNGIGDVCECEGDFACDRDVDGSDASTFKADFGRSVMVHPCSTEDSCDGDFNCDGDVDGTDASLFKQDFGRSSIQNPCPACVGVEWCGY